MKNIDDIRADFPILGETVNGKPLVYLDNAATAQKPLTVIEAVENVYRHSNGNIHRGVHTMAEQTTRRYEEARETVRSFIGAGRTGEVVFTAGATASVNTVAYAFGEQWVHKGDNIVLSEMEHHSNIVPWQLLAARKEAEIRVIPFDDDGRLQIEKLETLIDARTRIVAVTQTSNVLGTNPDLRTIIETAHAAGIPVLVDGCQGVAHYPVDVTALDCDFYVFSGHKLYGPTGIGVLYGKERWLAEMPPFLGGGDMIAPGSVTLPTGTRWAELPLKFEAGTSNYIGAIGLGAAIDYVQGLGLEQIGEHEDELLKYVTALLQDIKGLRIYGTTEGKCPIIAFHIAGTHPLDIAQIIDKMGVAIRTGSHCAEPVMRHYGVESVCRLSIGLYNTRSEMEIAAEAIARATKMLT